MIGIHNTCLGLQFGASRSSSSISQGCGLYPTELSLLQLHYSDGGSSLVFPYVDHPKFDTYMQNTWPNPAETGSGPVWLAAFTNIQKTLGARVDSVFLPETVCRRGAFVLLDSPGGTWFLPFDEPTFLGLWGSSAAQQLCRVGAISKRIAEGLYDPTVVPVDILPDTFPNTIDLSSSGRLPVAILSTSGFDATKVNPWTVKLAGASLQGFAGHHYHYPCRAGRAREEDVNGDGLLDMVVHFRVKTFHYYLLYWYCFYSLPPGQ